MAIATSNPGKLRDFVAVAKRYQMEGSLHSIEVVTLPGIDALPVPEENGETFLENARIKAEYYSRQSPRMMVVADDSGLEVEALGGAPGVRSARYAAGSGDTGAAEAGSDRSDNKDAANNRRLLEAMKDVPEAKRAARFVCALAVAKEGTVVKTFSGEASGRILMEPRGSGGFGYDPLLYIEETGKTFAEFTAEEKARYSHRGRAFEKLVRWLAEQ